MVVEVVYATASHGQCPPDSNIRTLSGCCGHPCGTWTRLQARGQSCGTWTYLQGGDADIFSGCGHTSGTNLWYVDTPVECGNVFKVWTHLLRRERTGRRNSICGILVVKRLFLMCILRGLKKKHNTSV